MGLHVNVFVLVGFLFITILYAGLGGRLLRGFYLEYNWCFDLQSPRLGNLIWVDFPFLINLNYMRVYIQVIVNYGFMPESHITKAHAPSRKKIAKMGLGTQPVNPMP